MFLAILLFLFTGRTAQAQHGPPLPVAVATTDVRAVKLLKDEFIPANPPTGKAGVIQQISQPVTCTITLSGPIPPGYLVTYSWVGLDFKGNDSAQTVTGYFHQPGFAVPVCTVHFYNPNGVEGWTQGECKTVYCIGGPITYGVYGGSQGTPIRRQSNVTTFAPGPTYSQYFTIDPATNPTGWQSPQCVTASPQFPYQAGIGTCTWTWTIPTSFKRLDTGNANASIVQLGATSVTSSSTAQLNFHFDNGSTSDPVTFDAADDSDQLMYINPFTDAGVVAPGLGQISALQPSTVTQLSKSHWVVNANVTGTNFTYCLKDQIGDAMPGVTIVERWESPFHQGSGQLWPSEQSASFVDSFYWDTGSPYNHPISGGVPIQTQTHRYYGATTNAAAYAATGLPGILVMTTTTKWYDDDTTNPPTP